MGNNVFFLKNQIPWFGKHTGYEQLINSLTHTDQAIINPSRTIPNRLIGKSLAILKNWQERDQLESYKELLLATKLFLNKKSCGHILYMENHLNYFSINKSINNSTVGTIHQPPSFWKKEDLKALNLVKHAIVLYEKDMDFFSSYIPDITFIPHGADIHFFTPKKYSNEIHKHLLLVGHHLRNFEMFERVSYQLLKKHPDVIIDILIPERFRNHPSLQALSKHERVHWHQKLNDEELRDLYQRAYLLFTPMNDSGANTAIIDCLASGAPIVSTDVGGIRNYGGGTIYPVVENNKDDDMISLINHYLANPSERDRVSQACRDFACTELAWDIISKKHQAVYEKLN